MFKKMMLMVTCMVVASLSAIAFAEGVNMTATVNSVVKEDMTPPMAEGPLKIDQIKPLMFSDKAK